MSNSTENSKRSVFLTGYPGFLGQHLLEALLKEWPEAVFYLLVQPTFVERAEAQLGEISSRIPDVMNRTEIVTGDITALRLGMPSKQYEAIFKNLTHAFHLAAIYDLGVPKNFAYKVNVTGTRNVLEALERSTKLEKLVYFSTCYVAGDRTGRIMEEDLDKGQSFKNYYEETKFKAEQDVRALMNKIPTVIIRPSIVVGHSQTGEIPKFDGPYYIIRLLSKLEKKNLLPKGIFLPYIGKSQAKLNITPVDYLIAVVMETVRSPDAVGKTFQVADPDPLVVKEFYQKAIGFFGLKAFGYVPAKLIELVSAIPGVNKLLEMPAEVVVYFNYHAEFDTGNVQQLIKDKGIVCPSPREYLKNMVAFTRATV